MPAIHRPPVLMTDSTNAFAHHTMRVRQPALLHDILTTNPDYPAQIQDAVMALHDAIRDNAKVEPLDDASAPRVDSADWQAAYQAQIKKHQPCTWHHCDWFFAETFCYRHVTQAVRWFENGRDPFAPKKQRELASGALWELLDKTLEHKAAPDEQLFEQLTWCLWGNRMDLSLEVAAGHGTHAADAGDLLVDDRVEAVRHILNDKRKARIHIVTDNTGTELMMDLVLVDLLLALGVQTVVLNLKAYPLFVSDALATDIWQHLYAMEHHGEQARDCARRLINAWQEGRVVLAPHFFWNSSHFLWDVPPILAHSLAEATLVIVKGDANYRRVIGDMLWEPTTSFHAVTRYFAPPLLNLRTLKSDPVVGLADGLAERLDSQDPQWRVTGQRGVIQFKPRTEA